MLACVVFALTFPFLSLIGKPSFSAIGHTLLPVLY